MLESNNKNIVVRGVDDFSDEDINKFWEERSAGSNNLLVLGLTTKNVCNLRCLYCFGTDEITGESEQTMSLADYHRVIDEAKELGVKTVVYCSNGEPLMDEKLPSILEHASQKGLTNAILTNATIMGNDRISKRVHGMSGLDMAQLIFDNNGSIIMSLDSLDEKNYDTIVNVRGSYKYAQQAMENMVRVGFANTVEDGDRRVTRLLLSMLANKLNFHEIPDVRSFAHDLGAQFVVKLPSLLGRANDNRSLFFDNNETTRWIREDYFKRMSDKSETVSADDIGRCGVWHYGIVVGSDGAIRQCFSVGDIGIGNVTQASLKALADKRQEKFLDRLFMNGCVTKDKDYCDCSRPKEVRIIPQISPRNPANG